MSQSKISISTTPLPEIPLKLSIAWIEKVTRDDVSKCWVISGTSKNGPRSLHIYDDGKVWNPGAKEKYDPELLPPETFIKDVYVHRKLIGEYFSVAIPDSKETIGITAKPSPQPIVAPSIYSIDWKNGPLPPEVTESNIWKLYQAIDQSDGLHVEKKQMALNGLKTQLFIKLHADWIAKMGVLHRTGNMDAFQSEKKAHIDKLVKQGDLNVDITYELSRLDDTLRGPPLEPYALAIHPKVSYIDTNKPVPNIESVKAEIRAEVKGFEDLADRILKVNDPKDKARVINVLVTNVNSNSNGGCAAARFKSATDAAFMECSAIEDKDKGEGKSFTIENVIRNQGMPESSISKMSFLIDEDDASDFSNYMDFFNYMKEVGIKLTNPITSAPYNFDSSDDCKNAARELYSKAATLNEFLNKEPTELNKSIQASSLLSIAAIQPEAPQVTATPLAQQEKANPELLKEKKALIDKAQSFLLSPGVENIVPKVENYKEGDDAHNKDQRIAVIQIEFKNQNSLDVFKSKYVLGGSAQGVEQGLTANLGKPYLKIPRDGIIPVWQKVEKELIDQSRSISHFPGVERVAPLVENYIHGDKAHNSQQRLHKIQIEFKDETSRNYFIEKYNITGLKPGEDIGQTKQSKLPFLKIPPDQIKPIFQDLEITILKEKYQYYATSTTQIRTHGSEATTKNLQADLKQKYQGQKGDHLKSNILKDFYEDIAKAGTPKEVEDIVMLYKQDGRYKILATGQDWATNFFNRSTTSAESFEKIKEERLQELSSPQMGLSFS